MSGVLILNKIGYFWFEVLISVACFTQILGKGFDDTSWIGHICYRQVNRSFSYIEPNRTAEAVDMAAVQEGNLLPSKSFS